MRPTPAADGRGPIPLEIAKNQENLQNTLIGNWLGMRLRGKFAHSDCRRGAHGVTRPTMRTGVKPVGVVFFSGHVLFNFLFIANFCQPFPGHPVSGQDQSDRVASS